MGMLYSILILIILGIIGLWLLYYSVRIKSITWFVASIFVIFFVGFFASINTIDELTISKNDVVEDLKHLDIVLNDDFKIVGNKVTGMPERYQNTEITVSLKDKSRILNKIKSSANFKLHSINTDDLANSEELVGLSDTIMNFRYPMYYKREKYGYIDNIPTRLFLIIKVGIEDNAISYSRWEE